MKLVLSEQMQQRKAKEFSLWFSTITACIARWVNENKVFEALNTRNKT